MRRRSLLAIVWSALWAINANAAARDPFSGQAFQSGQPKVQLERIGAWSYQETPTAGQTEVPNAPVELAVRANGERAFLTWSAPHVGASPTSYTLYRGDGSACTNLRGVQTGLAADSTYAEDFNVVESATYCYRMTARNSAGESGYSNAVVVKAVGPEAPFDLKVASTSDTAIRLRWRSPQDNGGGILDGYNIYRCELATTDCELEYHAWLPLTEGETYTDDEVMAGKRYRYAVAASRLGWLSAWSNRVRAAAQASAAPERPLDLTARANTNRAGLNWTVPDSGGIPASYTVFRGDGDGCNNLTTLQTDLSAESAYAEDTGIAEGATYCYRISASNSAGESPRSNTAVVQAVTPTAPTDLHAISMQSALMLDWSAPADNGGGAVDSYNVHRCEERKGEAPCSPVWHVWIDDGTSFSDHAVAPGVSYRYAVSSLRLEGAGRESPWSGQIVEPAPKSSKFAAEIWRGVDISYVNEMEDCGAVYRREGKAGDPFEILADKGANIARFRLWHTPDWTDYSTLTDVMKSIRRAKDAGMEVLLNFHYSDRWADPGIQEIPAAWRNAASDQAIAQLLYDYTRDTLMALHAEGLLPDFVQVGNEINIGIAHRDPTLDSWHRNPDRNILLLNSGISAVRDVGKRTGRDIGVILHIAQPENVESWLDRAHAATRDLSDFDMLGISYYSRWSRVPLNQMESLIRRLRHKYDKEIAILETAYPWTLRYNDSANNILGEASLVQGYPATESGQRKYLIDQLSAVVQGGGTGIVYWEPAWVTTSCGNGSAWENAAFFDYRNTELHEGADFLGFEYGGDFPVDIPDQNLRAAIETALGKSAGESITRDDMKTIMTLNLKGRQISDLTGIEFAVNLENLNLANNTVSDIAPLLGLPNLSDVNLAGNPLSNASIHTHVPELRSRGVGVQLDSAEAARSPGVWLFPSVSDGARQGFVRLINHSATSGEVGIEAVDDAGMRREAATLSLAAGQTIHFNSNDLEEGNATKGFDGIGTGQGDWRLQLSSDLDIEALSYIRTTDGFLTAMHDVAPVGENGHRVVTFNPASNVEQVSRLRLVNPGDESAEAMVAGVDDRGVSPGDGVRVSVPAGGAVTLTSEELETGAGLTGSLGDGTGKWRLAVTSERDIVAMSLLANLGTGHLTNLSTEAPAPLGGVHEVLLFPPASDPLGRQGFVRVVNRSNETGEVAIDAVDESDADYESLSLALGAGETVHFNSDDLELGNAAKGLTGSTGVGTGDWRLTLRSDLALEVLSYIRTPDGFLTSMHDVAPIGETGHRVVILNPGSNVNQVSRLRLVNRGGEASAVTVRGIDDSGASPGGEVQFSLPAGAVREYTAAHLEGGDEAFTGALGDGVGKWRLSVEASSQVRVMSLLESPTGHLTNLSTATRPEQ